MKRVKRAEKQINVARESEKSAVVAAFKREEDMAKDELNRKVELLMDQGKWKAARTLLEDARTVSPESHWILTQLAVTFYEEHNYADALKLLLASLEFKDDCPLTLWNLAGTLDALGQYDEAQRLFVWILKSKKQAADDPCWESAKWTATLKADALFRLGDTAMHQGDKKGAARFYQNYLKLLQAGIEGTYSVAEVPEEVRAKQSVVKPLPTRKTARKKAATGSLVARVSRDTKGSSFRVIRIGSFLKKHLNAWQQLVGQSRRRAASARRKRVAGSKE
ncbi:MAG TPA: tetratricopeptide repeat protein [Pirellulales bacterium]|nr:tetratricopeptide repeat protein [Pirellulales bacterium]